MCVNPTIYVTQLQAGTSASANHEFIEIFNYGLNPVALESCSITVSNASGQSIYPISVRSGLLVQPNSYVLLMNVDYLAALAAQPFIIPEMISAYSSNIIRLGGILTITDQNGSEIVTKFGPLSPASPEATVALQTNQLLKRCMNADGEYSQLSADKDNFVALKDTTQTQQYIFSDGPECPWVVHDEEELEEEDPEPEDPIDGEGSQPPLVPEHNLACAMTRITELLPNPAGADGGKEYIELWNPTGSALDLTGCGLQVAGSSKVYTFTNNEVLQPGEHRAFYDSQTGLMLPNAAGGKVWLIGSDNQELQEIIYPATIADDVAWAKFADGWALTFTQTPNAENIFMAQKPCEIGYVRNPETNRCVTELTAQTAQVPCPVGQERNSETNRCRNVVTTSASLTPCRAGQYRSPETNRCRNLETVAGSLVPCNENQERNPETNRCRLISTDSLVACKENQERNPETNRCRNVLGTNIGEDIPFAVTPVGMSNSSRLGWGIAGLVVVGAIGYGAYEWRREISRFAGKFLPIKTGKK